MDWLLSSLCFLSSTQLRVSSPLAKVRLCSSLEPALLGQPHTVTYRKLLSYLAPQVINWLLPTPTSWGRHGCFGQQPRICPRCSFDGYDKKTRLGGY